MKKAEFKIRFLPVAEEDLTGIVMYTAADNPPAARRLADRFENLFGSIGHCPVAGRIPDDPHLAELGYRYRIMDTYLVFSVIEDHDIIIHRILHGARDYAPLL